jgi:hypothetical protein
MEPGTIGHRPTLQDLTVDDAMDGEKMESNLSTSGLHVEVRAGVGCRHRGERRHEVAFAEDLMDFDSLIRKRDAMAPHVGQCFVQVVNGVSGAVIVTPVRIQALGEGCLIERGPGDETATHDCLVFFR